MDLCSCKWIYFPCSVAFLLVMDAYSLSIQFEDKYECQCVVGKVGLILLTSYVIECQG